MNPKIMNSVNHSVVAMTRSRHIQKTKYYSQYVISTHQAGNINVTRANAMPTMQKFTNGIKDIANSTVDMVRNPTETWKIVKDTAHHYWNGSKLLCMEIKMTYLIVKKMSQGRDMTRRERLQLTRTTMDIFRLVPFAIFVVIPFMEFMLPFALKLFPNMLPSTFQVRINQVTI